MSTDRDTFSFCYMAISIWVIQFTCNTLFLTHLLEDISTAADLAKQLAVGDAQVVVRRVPFPGKEDKSVTAVQTLSQTEPHRSVSVFCEGRHDVSAVAWPILCLSAELLINQVAQWSPGQQTAWWYQASGVE